MRLAAFGVAAALALAFAPAQGSTRAIRLENRILGYTVLLPRGWHAAVIPDDGSATIASYRPRSVYHIAVKPPRGETWIRLYDEGPLWSRRHFMRRRPPRLPAALPPVKPFEGFGSARRQTVVQAFRVRVDDSGANGIRGDSDDRIFATQGLFVP